MTEQQLLSFVDWSIDEVEAQLAEMKRQRDELADFVGGKRRSRHKLGSVYFVQFGEWLDGVRTTTERWESLG